VRRATLAALLLIAATTAGAARAPKPSARPAPSNVSAITNDVKRLADPAWEGRGPGTPMFSPDGRWLVFASNRNGRVHGETNLFLAEWRP